MLICIGIDKFTYRAITCEASMQSQLLGGSIKRIGAKKVSRSAAVLDTMWVFRMPKIYGNVIVLSLMISIIACSSSPSRKFVDVPKFQTVSVISSSELPALDHLKSEQEKTLEGAHVGSNTGWASGVALGLACGPFFWLCASAFGSMGYLLGGAGGIVYGATSVSVSEEHIQLIGEYLSKVDQQRDIQKEFYLELVELLPDQIETAARDADVLISPAILTIDVDEDTKERIHLHIKAQLLFSWSDALGKEHFGKEDFDVKSNSALVEDWLVNDGSLFDQAITTSITTLGRKMADHVINRVAIGYDQLSTQ